MSNKNLKVTAKKTKSLYKTLFTFLLVLIGALLLGRVVLSNILATSGQRLSAANQKISYLKEENSALQNSLSSKVSLEKLDEFAKQAGLIKAQNVQILAPSRPIASR